MALLNLQLSNLLLVFLELVLLVIDNSVSLIYSSLSLLFLDVFLLVLGLKVSHILVAIAQVHELFARVFVDASAKVFDRLGGCRRDRAFHVGQEQVAGPWVGAT